MLKSNEIHKMVKKLFILKKLYQMLHILKIDAEHYSNRK